MIIKKKSVLGEWIPIHIILEADSHIFSTEWWITYNFWDKSREISFLSYIAN